MTAPERVEAAAMAAFASAFRGCSWNTINPTTDETRARYRRDAAAGLAAADALLREPAAVERAARTVAIQDGWAPGDWDSGLMHAAKRSDYLRLSRAVISALLGERES